MKHYHLDMALKRARSLGFDVQRNHNSIGRTEVVVAWGDWELVKRGTYTTGNASGQAAFINGTIDRIMQVVKAKFPAVLYRSDSGAYFSVIAGLESFVWCRHDKKWQSAISSAHFIRSEMKEIGKVTIRREKMYWPEDLS